MLLRLLGDGKWHERERILAILADKIAPGKALRRYQVRAQQRETRYGPRMTPELSMEEQIASGRRTLANVAMNSLKTRYIEVGKNDAGEASLRIRPNVVLPDLGPPMPGLPGLAEPLPASAADFEAELDGFDGDEETEETEGEQAPAVPAAVPAAEPATERVDLACPACGLYVANRTQHDEWHAAGGAPPTTADLLEAAVPELVLLVRATVAEVVGQVVDTKLDGFQGGMSKFLDRWFAEMLSQQAQMIADARRPRPAPPQAPLKYTTQSTDQNRSQNRSQKGHRDRS